MRLGLSDSSCLETSVRMVYCAAFDCNANSSNNRSNESGLSSLQSQLCFNKSKLQADEAQSALLASRKVVSTAIRTREDGNPGLSWC